MGTFAIYNRSVSGPTREELAAIEIITDNVAQAIAWVRNPDATMQASNLLPRQVAALGAIVAAIEQQASALDSEGQRAVDAVVKASDELAEVVRRHVAEPQADIGISSH
jgi:hypothetical protein